MLFKVSTDVAITLEIDGCEASSLGIESNSLHSLHGARVDLKLPNGVGSTYYVSLVVCYWLQVDGVSKFRPLYL